MPKKQLIERIRSGDPDERGDAWQGAAGAGPDVIPDLAELAGTGELEVSRAAKRALWKIVRHVGRPGAAGEKTPVVSELTSLLHDDCPVPVRREVLWMLSELAESGAPVERCAALLEDPELREDACMVLERIPGDQALAALKKALPAAPEDFKPSIAQSLRARGVEVPGIPCRKLLPTRPTGVKATST